MSLREASERMEVSYWHAKRLKRVVACDEPDPGGLIHGKMGRRPANAIGMDVRQRVVELSRTHYASFNDTHFAEKLVTVEGIRWVGRRNRTTDTGILSPNQRIGDFPAYIYYNKTDSESLFTE